MKRLEALTKNMSEEDFFKVMGPFNEEGGSGIDIYYHNLDDNLRLMSGIVYKALRYSYIIDKNRKIQRVVVA